ARLKVVHGTTPGVRLLLLDENRQFAGGLNAGARAAFAAGAERVLLLNNDTELAPDALRLLGAALDAAPGAGIAGRRLVDRATDRVLSLGERHVLWLLCVPRTWLRHRGPLDRPYPVRGVMGARCSSPGRASRPWVGSIPTSRSTTRTWISAWAH